MLIVLFIGLPHQCSNHHPKRMAAAAINIITSAHASGCMVSNNGSDAYSARFNLSMIEV